MPYQLFYDLFPEVADVETRSVTVLGLQSETGLPPGQYTFCEMFCNERGCDCRRAFFYVVSSFRPGPEAIIAWGWESPEFYLKWLGDYQPDAISELIGPTLNLGSPATELAGPLLHLFSSLLLQDDAYVERVKRHYQQFRNKIDGKTGMRKAASRKRKRRKRKT